MDIYNRIRKITFIALLMVLLILAALSLYFSPAGAEGFKKDDPNTIVKFYDTGHFALETNSNEIGQDILDFMAGLPQ